jgi:hypothetical protein
MLAGLIAATPAAALRARTKIKVDSRVALGQHTWLYAGQVACGGTLRLVGIKPGGAEKELDWTLTSFPGGVWALAGTRQGFNREFIEVRESTHCTGAKVRVFPR